MHNPNTDFYPRSPIFNYIPPLSSHLRLSLMVNLFSHLLALASTPPPPLPLWNPTS